MTLACKTPWAASLQISLLQQQRWEKSCSWWGSMPLHDTVAVCVCACMLPSNMSLHYICAWCPQGPRGAFSALELSHRWFLDTIRVLGVEPGRQEQPSAHTHQVISLALPGVFLHFCFRQGFALYPMLASNSQLSFFTLLRLELSI